MLVGLDVPERIIPGWILIARHLSNQEQKQVISYRSAIRTDGASPCLAHLLLLKPPLWQLDLMRKQITSTHDMSQPEMTP